MCYINTNNILTNLNNCLTTLHYLLGHTSNVIPPSPYILLFIKFLFFIIHNLTDLAIFVNHI